MISEKKALEYEKTLKQMVADGLLVPPIFVKRRHMYIDNSEAVEIITNARQFDVVCIDDDYSAEDAAKVAEANRSKAVLRQYNEYLSYIKHASKSGYRYVDLNNPMDELHIPYEEVVEQLQAAGYTVWVDGNLVWKVEW